MVRTIHPFWTVLLLLFACSSERVSETSEVAAPLSFVAASSIQGPGFFHTLARSKFSPGDGKAAVSDLGLQKTVGIDGVFAVDPRNGSVRALLNSDAPAKVNFRPFTTSLEAHNGAILDYFVAAGLPRDQVSDVRGFPSLRRGRDALGMEIKQDELVDIASVVHREIGGIPVPDSYAWAILDANGRVVQEAIHWPTIPDAVVNAAKEIERLAADPSARAALSAALPLDSSKAEPGFAAIRHGSTAEADPSPFASFDVTVKTRGNRTTVRHFDISGRELIHPSSKVSFVSSGTKAGK